MKRLLLTMIAGVLSISLFAQTHVERNQSVALDVLGLQYYNETPAGAYSTFIFHGGLAGELAYSSSSLYFNNGDLYYGEYWGSSVRGTVGLEYRYYYNLAKRAREGKNTRKNSANFISANLQDYTPAMYSHNMIKSIAWKYNCHSCNIILKRWHLLCRLSLQLSRLRLYRK